MQSDTDSVEDAQDALQVTVTELEQAGSQSKELAHKSWRRNGIINNAGSQQCESTTAIKTVQQTNSHGNKHMNSQGQLKTMDGGRHSENHNVDKSKGNSQQAALADELRISKILRRLMCENNGTKASELCDKLEIAVRAPSNAAYICRSFDYIMDSMLQLLKHCPGQVLHKCSQIMGLLGYINHNDFAVYKNYITKAYQSHKELQKYLMLALKTTIK